MERMWFRGSLAARPAEDDRERQARKRRRRIVIGCAVVAGLLALLIARADYRALGIAYWQSQAQPCGTFVVYAGRVKSGDPQAAMTCFMHAYAQCRAATLSEGFFSTDMSPTYTYLAEPQLLPNGSAKHTCSLQVTDVVEPMPQNPWVSCADVAQRWYGLHFYGCGWYGDLVVSVMPLTQEPSGLACGDIHLRPTPGQSPPYAGPPVQVDNTARNVVSCFLQAYQTCQPAWAAATRTYPDPTPQPASATPLQDQDRQMFLVEPHGGTCSVLELEWHMEATTAWYFARTEDCRSLVLKDEGLYVSQCKWGPAPQLILPVCAGQPPMIPNVPTFRTSGW